mmetsp:Transcript_99159/g.172010  ORF Transcript_99159/g.172010 Transcript_99159/m.172010 type:complete len:432 (-) Transcript_99159:14-1309(-)
MRVVELSIVCFSCVCHARRTRTSVDELQGNPLVVDAAAAFNPSFTGASSEMSHLVRPVATRAPATVAQAEDRLRQQLRKEQERLRELKNENKQIPKLERQLQRQEKDFEKTLKAQEGLKEQIDALKAQIAKKEDAIKEGDTTKAALEEKSKALDETEAKLETTLQTLQVLLSEQAQMKAKIESQDPVTEVLIASDKEKILAAELETTKKEVEMLQAREIQLMTQIKIMEKALPAGPRGNFSLAAINATAEDRALAFQLSILEKQTDTARQMSLASAERIAAAEQSEMDVRQELESVKEKSELDVKTLSDEMLKREDMAERAQTQVQKLESQLEDALKQGTRITRFQEKLNEAEDALKNARNSSRDLGVQNLALANERDELRSYLDTLGIKTNITESISTAEAQLAAVQADKEASAKKERKGLGNILAKLFN